MNNKPTEEEGKKTMTEIMMEERELIRRQQLNESETVGHIMRGVLSGMSIGCSEENLKRIVEICYEELKPTLDRLRKHDTGEEEIKPIKI